MRITVLIACLVGSGCIVKGKGQSVANVFNGVAIVGGAVLAASAGSALNHEPEDRVEGFVQAWSAPALTAALLVGVAAVVGGTVGLLGTAGVNAVEGRSDAAVPTPAVPSEEQATPTGPPSTVSAANPAAVQLTRDARVAAGAGHCGVVKALGPKVAAADAAYYAAVFTRDPIIARCR